MNKRTAILAQMVLPYQANPAGNVHGGEIMKMMDSAAGVAASKYARTNTVTARVDELKFRRPVFVGNLVTCTAQVIYVGNTSMEVFVAVEAEDLTSTYETKIALTAFFTMVSLDKNGVPSTLEPIDPSALSDYDKKLYYEGEKRYFSHKERKKNQQNTF